MGLALSGVSIVSKRVCGTCGSTQGPFDSIFIGYRKTGIYLFTCPITAREADGRPVTEAKRKEIAMACNNRREKNNVHHQT